MQQLAPGRDEELHVVAGPLLRDANGALDRSIFDAGHRAEHTLLISETSIFTVEQRVLRCARCCDMEPASTYRNSTFISTDSHVTEPIDLYGERVDREYRDRVPRIEVVGDWRSLLIEGLRPRKLMPASEREFAIVGDWDADDRRRDQSRDGVSAEVIFPTFALQACFASDDAALQLELCRAYNGWAAEVFGGHARAARGRHGADARHRRRDRRSAAPRRRGLPRAVPSRARSATPVQRSRVRPRSGRSRRTSACPLTFHSGTGHEPRVVRGPGGAVVNYILGAQLDGPMVMLTMAAGGALDRFPGPAARHGRDRRRVARLDHDPGRRDLRRSRRVRAAEAVAEAERAHPAPGPRHVHVRPGRDQQPRDHRRRDADVGQRLPAPRGHVARRRRRSRRAQFDGVSDADLHAIVAGNAAEVFGFDLRATT